MKFLRKLVNMVWPLRDAHFEEAVSVSYRKIFLVYLYPHIVSHDQLT